MKQELINLIKKYEQRIDKMQTHSSVTCIAIEHELKSVNYELRKILNCL